LIDSLLKNAVSSEKSLFTLSFSIIVALITNFRDNLKAEIAVFIENIFLKLLESNNSNFDHRLFTLHVFNKMFKIPRVILELYVNYDCQLKEKCMVETIINLLAKIT